MRTHLKVSPGGVIASITADESLVDVSDQAVAYLFDSIILEPGVTLGDFFKIVERNPILLQVFHRGYAEDIMASVQSCSADQHVDGGLDGVEYICFSWDVWPEDGSCNYRVLPELAMFSVDYVSSDTETVPVCQRERWSLSMCHPAALMKIPVLLIPDIKFAGASQGFFIPTLGSVIEAIFCTLSLFGPPDSRQGMIDKFCASVADGSYDFDEESLQEDYRQAMLMESDAAEKN